MGEEYRKGRGKGINQTRKEKRKKKLLKSVSEKKKIQLLIEMRAMIMEKK